MAITDRYGLAVTTPSAVAAARFQDGMDRLLSYDAGAEESFAAAVRADERLAVAHAGIALVAVAQGDAATARAAAGRARHRVAGATRRERQHVEALSALIGGETARGLALVDEHVAEDLRQVPGMAVERVVVQQHHRHAGRLGGTQQVGEQ